MPIDMNLKDFCNAYDLYVKAKNGLVYMEILRGIYVQTEAGILANKMLRAQLAKFRYFEVLHTPVLWKRVYRLIYFTLVGGYSGIKYVGG